MWIIFFVMLVIIVALAGAALMLLQKHRRLTESLTKQQEDLADVQDQNAALRFELSCANTSIELLLSNTDRELQNAHKMLELVLNTH